MTILEALRATTENIKTWVENKFLKKGEITADDFGIYVQDTEPINAIHGDIWVDTSNKPILKIKKIDDSWQEVAGEAISENISAPKLTSVTMLANAWEGSNDIYSQIVTCNGVGTNSKLDLQPTPEQIVQLQNDEISLMAANTDGVVTIFAIGSAPTFDITTNVLITEVTIV